MNYFFSILNQDFSIHFGEIFTVQIVKWPESIKLQIFESKLLTSKLLAEIYVPIPDVQETVKSTSSIEQYLFTSSEELTFTHSAVGSGVFTLIMAYMLKYILITIHR